jgi:hypothetical protein
MNYNSPGITWNGHCYEQCPCELREAAGEKQLPAASAKRRFTQKIMGPPNNKLLFKCYQTPGLRGLL